MKKINMKLDKDKLMQSIIVLVTLNIFLVVYHIIKEQNILFVFNVVISILTIIKCKSSFFSIKTIILNYILSPIFFQYNLGRSYGILETTDMHLYYMEINIFLIIYNMINYLILINTNILEKEKQLLQLKPNTTKIFANICSVIAIIFSIIALPYLPFQTFENANRFESLLPGRAWNHLVIVALIFASPQIKNNNFVKVAFAFCIFWFLSHFERVDIIGLIVVIAILLFYNIKSKMSKKEIIKYIVVGILILTVLLKIGEIRDNNKGKVNYIEKVLLQNTASDLGYVFNSSIEYINNNEPMKGKTYLAYLVETIPLLTSNERIETILQNLYKTPGGSYLLSEPLVNFGLIGVIVFELLEFVFISIILNMKSDYKYYIYCFLIATLFRSCWYGLIYIEIGVLYFIPVMYLMKKSIELINNKIQTKKLGEI